MGIPLPLITCSDSTLSLSSFSGSVTLTLHCPGDLIQPTLWNNRRLCLEYQLCYLGLLIQQISNQNPSVGDSLTNQYNDVVGKLMSLPPVTAGQPVTHEQFNAIWDHISLAYNVLTNFFSIVWGYGSAQPAQVVPYENQLLYVINNIPKKKTMDLMRASDWNALTQALYAIDQILQYIKQNWLLPVMQGQVTFAGVNVITSTSFSSPSISVVIVKASTSMTTSVGTGKPP